MAERKWRSPQWKALSGLLLMISTTAVVWAALATFTVYQRERDLNKVYADLLDAREQLEQIRQLALPSQPEPLIPPEVRPYEELEEELLPSSTEDQAGSADSTHIADH